MNLLDWTQEIPEPWQLYALIDPLADSQPLHYWYQHAIYTDAWPLYAGTEYSDDLLAGPWLLPLEQLPGWEDWWQQQESNHSATGLLLASEYPIEKLVQHWKSLLKAGLDGEEVLFRFYDPRVLGPMLFALSETETRILLGPTNEMLLWYDKDWLAASPYPEPDLTEHTEPWWRIKMSHLAGVSGQKERLVENLDNWLWQHEPELMSEWLQKHEDVRQQLLHDYDTIISEPGVTDCHPSLLVFRLFGYQNEWLHLQTYISAEPDDEQTELLDKTIQFIKQEQQKQKEMRE